MDNIDNYSRYNYLITQNKKYNNWETNYQNLIKQLKKIY